MLILIHQWVDVQLEQRMISCTPARCCRKSQLFLSQQKSLQHMREYEWHCHTVYSFKRRKWVIYRISTITMMTANFIVALHTTHCVEGKGPQHQGHCWLRGTQRQKVKRMKTGYRVIGCRYVWRFHTGKERQPIVRHLQAGKFQG